jgi:hypothetical protein
VLPKHIFTMWLKVWMLLATCINDQFLTMLPTI